MLTIGELFAGIGGFSLAFEAAGFETAWFVENEAYCQQVLAKNYPGVPIYGDIHGCHDLPHVDVMTAGFPCQPFSTAGKGLGREDERYLVPEMLRVIREVQPYVVLFENVPRFRTLNDGIEFKTLLRALTESGYDVQWLNLRASDVGAPHVRKRWFAVAYADSRRHPGTDTANMRQTAHHQQRHAQAGHRSHVARPPLTNGEPLRALAYAKKSRQGEFCSGYESQLAHTHRQHEHRWRPASGQSQQQQPTRVRRGQHRPAQSRLGRTAARLSTRLDGHRGWPARPNEAQYSFEPPRITTRKDNRAARLKALGNAVVPQVVYPIALSIRDWLEAQS